MGGFAGYSTELPAGVAVTVENLTKTFRIGRREASLKRRLLQPGRKNSGSGEFTALDNINLEIPEGKTFGLLGHNGSGKSTLLKCIAKILTPNTGRIAYSGRMAAMLEVGSGFHPELTGRENIYLNGAILGMSRAEMDAKFDSIVDFSGVERFIDQPVKNYSSGMYVRLGFSVAIHVEPEILLVDEVLAVGDLEFQEKCMNKFAQLKNDGHTVVVVSHGLEQMRTFCDQAAWLDHGKLMAVGPAAEVIDQYADKAHGVQLVPGGGTRFGSGEALLTKMEWLNSAGEDVRQCRTGEEITIRLHYEAHEDIPNPVFGCSIDTREGYWVWGTQALDNHYIPEVLPQGSGWVDVKIPRLPLRPGTYLLSASIQNRTLTSMIDAWQKGVTFEVLAGEHMDSGGIVSFWSEFGGLNPPQKMEDF